MRRFLPDPLPAVLLLLPVLAGCGPSCERVCNKLLTCGEQGFLETDRFSHQECEISCERQGTVFIGWEDEDVFREAWDEHRSCLADSDCEEIAEGVCYDERFFIIRPIET